jgi:hypothetical protein
MKHLFAHGQELDFRSHFHRLSHTLCQFPDRIGLVRPYIEDVATGSWIQRRLGNHGCNVAHIGERASLTAIAKDGERLSLRQLVHENPNDVAVRISKVLPFPVNIVRPKDNVVQPKYLTTDFEFLLDSQFGDSV